jgi:hypothetical protein
MIRVTQTSEDIFGFEKFRLTDKTEEEHRGISNTSLVLNTKYPENTEKGVIQLPLYLPYYSTL